MKSKFRNTAPFILLIGLFLISSMVHAQVTVTLTVNTETITEAMNGVDLNGVCSFGQPAGTTNEDYVTEIDLGQSVEWVGVAENGTDVVNIRLIQHLRGPNPFPNRDEYIISENGSSVGVTPARETSGNGSKYLLLFTIESASNPISRQFKIDPYLRVR